MYIKKKIILSLCLILSLFFIHGVFAQDETLFKRGKVLYDAGNFTEALQIFKTVFREDPTNKNINFYLGMSAYNSGDFETASIAFDRILIMNPELPRVRLELARSYFRLGLYDMSLLEFENVAKTDDLPKNVSKNIKEYMERIRETKKRANKKHFFSGVLSISGTIDSNSRQSPSATTVSLPNVPPVNIATEKDEYMAATLVLNHEYRMNKNKVWKSTFVNYNSWYDVQTDLDVDYYYLMTGPKFLFEKSSLQLGVLGSYMGKNDESYLRSIGLSSTFSRKINNNLQLSLNMKGEDKTYKQDPDYSGFNFQTSIDPVFIYGKNLLTFSLGYGVLNAKANKESYDKGFIKCRYTRFLPSDFSVYGGYNYERALYDGIDATLATKRRQDDISEFYCGVRKIIGKKFAIDLEYQYTRAYSDVKLYDYYKHVGTVTFSYNF